MEKASVHDVDGALMIELPIKVVKELNLSSSSKVDVFVSGSGLGVRPRRRPKYSLEDLIAKSDPRAFEPTEEDKAWDRAEPVGRELF